MRRLLRDGHETHLLLRRPDQTWRLRELGGHVSQHHAHIENGAAVRAIVQSVRPDWVFHLAAYGAHSSQTGMEEMVATNVMGTVHLLDACAGQGVEAFVYAGSSSEYGCQDRPATEGDALDPNSRYAVTKAAASHYCVHTARASGLNAIVLRLYSLYGPYEDPSRLVPSLLTHGLRGSLPPLVSPETAHDFVYVEDAVDAMLAAASAPDLPRGSVFNVCTGVQTTLAEIVALVRRLLNVSSEPKWGTMPSRVWDTSTWCGDPTKSARELNWRAGTSLEEGLNRTISWLRDHPEVLRMHDAPAFRNVAEWVPHV